MLVKPRFVGGSVHPLPEVVWFQEGPGVRNHQYTDQGVKLLNVANLHDGRLDTSNTNRYISENEAYGRYEHFLVDAGDLVIASSGIKVEYFDQKMGFARPEHLPLCMNTSTIRFKSLDQDKLDIEFFMLFLKSNQFKRQLSKQITGSAQLNFGPSHLKKMKLVLPVIGDQKEIIARLKHLQAEIDRLLSLEEKFDLLVKSQFVEMFGDTYLNSMAWGSCKLGELISFMTSGSRGWARYYSDDGEYFLTIKNVKKCKVDVSGVQHVIAPVGKESARTKVQESDVLISITADLGRTGVVTKEIADHGAYINQHLACIRLTDDSVDPVFLSHFLESPGGIDQFAKKNQNGVKAGLNFNLIRSLEIQMPPLALQQEFAAFVTQVDKLRFKIQQQIEKLEMLKKSLMQEYFGQ